MYISILHFCFTRFYAFSLRQKSIATSFSCTSREKVRVDEINIELPTEQKQIVFDSYLFQVVCLFWSLSSSSSFVVFLSFPIGALLPKFKIHSFAVAVRSWILINRFDRHFYNQQLYRLLAHFRHIYKSKKE